MTQSKSRLQKRLIFWGLGSLLLFGGCSILAGIAGNGFEQQANKARESEAETYLKSMLRGQQAHFLDEERFAGDLQSLSLNISEETENYSYAIALPDPSGQTAIVTATARLPELRSFTGVAFAIADSQGEFATTATELCVSNEPGQPSPAMPELNQTGDQVEIVCAEGSQVVE
jgi:type IV pilus assembly protein PilA